MYGRYETVDELGLSFDYVQAKPGECVVWSKRTYLPPQGHEPLAFHLP